LTLVDRAELTVSAGIAGALVVYAVSRGADGRELVSRAEIDPADIKDQDARVAMRKYVTLVRAAAELTGDPAFSLHFGEAVDMSKFSIVGLIFPTCEYLSDAILQVNRYGQLVTEVDVGAADRFQLIRRSGHLWMVDTRRNPNDFPELTEATFARFVSMVARVGIDRVVTEIHVTHPAPAHASEYEHMLRAPTRFEMHWNAMRIEESMLSRPIALQPRYAFGVLSRHAEALMQELRHARTIRQRVEQLIMPILHTGTVNMADISASLGCSRQTLFRKLKAEGTTFEKVCDDLRRTLALHYLEENKVSVHEVAYLIGYSDPASFSRAFRRWTGSPPSSARGRRSE